jgi:alpha-glucoside transport system ATP-binding protein
MSSIKLDNLTKKYGEIDVIKGVNIEINSGEFVVIVGPSGCGKSTMLRMIAGLEKITNGDVLIDGKVVNDIEPAKRDVAMVFQSYALYPHLSVFENIAFGLKIAKLNKDLIKTKVSQVASALELSDQLNKLPKQLSGGQRQRVAIARAMVREPKVFLFDEPLSNLDAGLRVNTRIELAKLHQSISATMVYVTHDQVEALTLAEKIVVLNEGVVEQYGTPMELYFKPVNKFIASFIGSPKMNFIDAKVVEVNKKGCKLNILNKVIDSYFSFRNVQCDQGLSLGIRPENLTVVSQRDCLFNGSVEIIEYLGEYNLIYIRIPQQELLCIKVDIKLSFNISDVVYLGAQSENIHVFNEDGLSIYE